MSNQSNMKFAEFYKMLTYKMDIIGKAREESYNKMHKFLEGMPPNDTALPQIAKSIIETEMNLQDMMHVINNIVDRQLEAYDDINTLAVELLKKRQESRPRVKFVDENEDKQENMDGSSDAKNNGVKNVATNDDNEDGTPSAIEKENERFAPVRFPREMPPSPVLSSSVNNSILSSIKRPASHFSMPQTPPTTHKSYGYNQNYSNIGETPRMPNFDDTLM